MADEVDDDYDDDDDDCDHIDHNDHDHEYDDEVEGGDAKVWWHNDHAGENN